MSDTINNKFKSSYGLDANNEKVINVADASKNSPSDGVNVRYLIQENTIQKYDPNRGYVEGFSVIYNNRIWTSNRNMVAPVGPFIEEYWTNTRNDPKWVVKTGGNINLTAGDYISVDTTQGNDINFTLPAVGEDGDTITIKDIGGRPGYAQVSFVSNVQSIVENSTKKKTVYMSHPLSQMVFVFNNRLWNLYTSDNNTTYNIVDTSNEHQSQASEFIIRNYNDKKPIVIILPRVANDGDCITFADTEINASLYHTIIKTYDNTKSIEVAGTYQKTYKDFIGGLFIYNATNKIWKYIKKDNSPKTKVISTDTTLNVTDDILVYGQTNSTATVNLTLPTKVDIGDRIKINLTYIRPTMTVNINANPSVSDTIWTNKTALQFPRRSQHKPTTDWFITKSLSFNGEDYLPIITLSYQEDQKGVGYWIAESTPVIERVDAESDYTRARVGVIAIANQNQANIDKENNPNREVAITPETLSNRTALENRRGIARIATTGEVNQDSTANYYDDIIITPKKLNERTATETRRGLAEIATQQETNSGTDDTVIITPKKLEARRATDSMAGIAPLVKRWSSPMLNYGNNINRDTVGTGIYNYGDYSNIVTPATLREYQSNELQLGAVYLATEAEVIAGADNSADRNHPIVVTPFQLHKKTATEGRIGFTQIATQQDTNSGTDDFKFITPKKLEARRATETMAGISPIATQSTFNAGSDNTQISTPLKIKTWFNDGNRTYVNTDSGLQQQGTLWSTYKLDIQSAQEGQRGTLKLATQSQTAAGSDDTTAITPLKLQNRRATELTDGIIQIANAQETTDGNVGNKSVSPKNLKNTIQIDVSWEANQTRRGTVKLTEKSLTFVGNNVQGNTQDLNNYIKTGYAVSPYELNLTLQNYLPLRAKAVDSDLLDGIDSSQFIRRDIDQVVDGVLTFSKSIQANQNINVNGAVNVGSNVIANGTLYVNTGFIRSNDTLRYIDLGQQGRDKITLATWDGIFSFLNTKNNNSVATINQNGLSTANVDVSNTYSINSVTAVQADADGSPLFGNFSKNIKLFTSDANNFRVQDPSGYFQILSEKNYVSITGRNFVNKAGDTISGRLTINAPVYANISQDQAAVNKIPDNNNYGFWSAEITAEPVYRNLPGYVVPIYDVDRNTGQVLPSVSSYKEVRGPGTLTQFGASPTSAYQIWAPRPTTKEANNLAQTFYMRSFNPVTGMWDGFGRLYTSNNPPTASDIGAIADNGSSFKSMRVQDWLQIDNLRIVPDPTTKSVRFEWID